MNKFSIFQRSPSDAREATEKGERQWVRVQTKTSERQGAWSRVTRFSQHSSGLTKGPSPPDDHPQPAFLVVLCRIIQTPEENYSTDTSLRHLPEYQLVDCLYLLELPGRVSGEKQTIFFFFFSLSFGYFGFSSNGINTHSFHEIRNTWSLLYLI